MTSIDAATVKALSLKEEGAVADAYYAQLGRIADAGINVTPIAPAQGGGLIVKCAANDVQAVYDAVFGGSYIAPKISSSNVVSFVKPETNDASVLSGVFKTSAAKSCIGMDFGRASRMVASVSNVSAPALVA